MGGLKMAPSICNGNMIWWRHQIFWCHHSNVVWLLWWRFPPLYRQLVHGGSSFILGHLPSEELLIIMAEAQLSLLQTYAIQLKPLIPKVAKTLCFGCQVDHPSQAYHSVCLMMGEKEKVRYCLPEAVELLDQRKMWKLFRRYVIWQMSAPAGIHLRGYMDQPALGRWAVVWCHRKHHHLAQMRSGLPSSLAVAWQNNQGWLVATFDPSWAAPRFREDNEYLLQFHNTTGEHVWNYI